MSCHSFQFLHFQNFREVDSIEEPEEKSAKQDNI
jgi:hypothetical protein